MVYATIEARDRTKTELPNTKSGLLAGRNRCSPDVRPVSPYEPSPSRAKETPKDGARSSSLILGLVSDGDA